MEETIKKLEEAKEKLTASKSELEKQTAEYNTKIAELLQAKDKKEDEIHEATKKMLEKKKEAASDQLKYLTEVYDNEIKPQIQEFCDALKDYFEPTGG